MLLPRILIRSVLLQCCSYSGVSEFGAPLRFLKGAGSAVRLEVLKSWPGRLLLSSTRGTPSAGGPPSAPPREAAGDRRSNPGKLAHSSSQCTAAAVVLFHRPRPNPSPRT